MQKRIALITVNWKNWVNANLISIKGYRPELLGTSDDEALAGLLNRISGLVEFSRARAERALVLFSQNEPDRAQGEPIILESALETARVTADVLFTVFTLGLNPNTGPGTTGLIVHLTAPALAENDEQEVRVVLLNSPFSTLAEREEFIDAERWRGRAAYRHLPAGTYEVVAYRPGAKAATVTVTLAEGETKEVEVHLESTDPPQNLVYNPDFSLRTLPVDVPDRWAVTANGDTKIWTSAPINLKPGTAYRCGANFKAPQATVNFVTQPAQAGAKGPQPFRLSLNAAQAGQQTAEAEIRAEAERMTLVVQIFAPSHAPQVVEKVWVVPNP